MQRSLALGAATVVAALALSSSAPAADPTPSPTVCNGTISNQVVGDVVVPYRASCVLDGVYVDGAVTATVSSRDLTLTRTIVAGDLVTDGARGLTLDRAIVAGKLDVREPSGPLAITRSAVSGAATVGSALNEATIGGADGGTGNAFAHGLTIDGAYGPLAVRRNVVGGDLVVRGAVAGSELRRNVVGGELACRDNDPAPTGGGNLASSTSGQCAGL
ncbi:hypothetical protein [Patulibacter defluvii]|uniref:hypothetical protein n=1 Tax=Patulibacter defluvii TaxID=3095358 RepID=UPI002A7659C7|nr:hypothetical protein [Patulibacter sp. DM4]